LSKSLICSPPIFPSAEVSIFKFNQYWRLVLIAVSDAFTCKPSQALHAPPNIVADLLYRRRNPEKDLNIKELQYSVGRAR
jgi:hypothetical protein